MSEVLNRSLGKDCPLHIRLATWDDEPPVGGQGVYVRELRRALESARLRVTTISGRGPHAVPYQKLTGHGPLDLSISLNVSVGRLISESPDVVHISGGPGGLQIIRRLTTPVVYTAYHTFELAHPWYKPQRWYGRLERQSYQLAQMIVAISTSTANSLLRMGVSAKRIVVIPPGVDANRLYRRNLRGHKRLMFVGRLEPEKGPIEALQVMKEVVKQVPGASGLIVGSGSLRTRVESQVTPDIEYRPYVSDEELVELYAYADIVLMPSAFEGFGLVALEAMASGCAVIGYDVAGLHEVLGPYGVLVNKGDVEGLIKSSTFLLNHPARREEIGAAAAQAIGVDHSWKRCAEDVVGVYRTVLGR